MAGTLTISTLSDGTNSTSSTNCISGSAKAWVNFNGTSGSIRSSYNVSSVTRNGTGNYTVNYTNAMSNTNYNVVYGGPGIIWGGSYNTPATVGNDNSGYSTTSCVIRASIGGNIYVDPNIVTATVFSN